MCRDYTVYTPLPNFLKKKQQTFSIQTFPHRHPLIHDHTLPLANGSSNCHLSLPFAGQGHGGLRSVGGGECADDLGFPGVTHGPEWLLWRSAC